MKWFEADDSRALERRLREGYEVNGQTAWALLTKTERFQVRIITGLSDEQIHRLRMSRAAAIADALAGISGDTRGYILPRGAALLPLLNK
jgi:hypothetical protein